MISNLPERLETENGIKLSGGNRIGAYMRWLLETFDRGSSTGEAIENANKLFTESWGMDKVIDMGHNKFL